MNHLLLVRARDFQAEHIFEATKKGTIFICRKKLCRKLGNISQEKCLEFRMDHDVVYLEMIHSGTDGGPILCPSCGFCIPCPILYDNLVWQTLFSVVPRRIFFVLNIC